MSIARNKRVEVSLTDIKLRTLSDGSSFCHARIYLYIPLYPISFGTL